MKKKFKLTREEREIEGSLGNEKQWVSGPDSLKETLVQAAKRGASSRKREARVNIRLTQGTVDLIRSRAEKEGLGYQTLMSSVLHKYATGRFVEKEVIDQVATEIASKVQTQRKR